MARTSANVMGGSSTSGCEQHEQHPPGIARAVAPPPQRKCGLDLAAHKGWGGRHGGEPLLQQKGERRGSRAGRKFCLFSRPNWPPPHRRSPHATISFQSTYSLPKLSSLPGWGAVPTLARWLAPSRRIHRRRLPLCCLALLGLPPSSPCAPPSLPPSAAPVIVGPRSRCLAASTVELRCGAALGVATNGTGGAAATLGIPPWPR